MSEEHELLAKLRLQELEYQLGIPAELMNGSDAQVEASLSGNEHVFFHAVYKENGWELVSKSSVWVDEDCLDRLDRHVFFNLSRTAVESLLSRREKDYNPVLTWYVMEMRGEKHEPPFRWKSTNPSRLDKPYIVGSYESKLTETDTRFAEFIKENCED